MKSTLRQKLLVIMILNGLIIGTVLLIILPNLLYPLYERNVYFYLNQSEKFIDEDKFEELEDISYLVLKDDRLIQISTNYYEFTDLNPYVFLEQIRDSTGKLEIGNRVYYYSIYINDEYTKILLTGGEPFTQVILSSINTILILTVASFIGMTAIIYVWSDDLIKKVYRLKNRIDNLEKEPITDNKVLITDEISILEDSIEVLRRRIINNDKEKNEMFQNISHDLKTPIAIIKSHSEALKDEIIDTNKALEVIDEQIEKLNTKVTSLLYLNKLSNLEFKEDKIKLKDLILKAIPKFEIMDDELEFILKMDDSLFNGNEELWDAVVSNILDNFLRYAERKIEIIIKDNKITFKNDGPQIDESFIEVMFLPFEKGNLGNFGLGLAIVKKTVNLLNYDIKVKNEKDGVSFIIE